MLSSTVLGITVHLGCSHLGFLLQLLSDGSYSRVNQASLFMHAMPKLVSHPLFTWSLQVTGFFIEGQSQDSETSYLSASLPGTSVLSKRKWRQPVFLRPKPRNWHICYCLIIFYCSEEPHSPPSFNRGRNRPTSGFKEFETIFNSPLVSNLLFP